jgi:hypothetical protein
MSMEADNRSSIYAPTDRSVNRYGPQILQVGILAALGLAFGIASFVYASSMINHAQLEQQAAMKELKTQFRLVDDDWQKQTAWLYAHGVAKDKHGNLYLEDEHGRSTANNH